MAVKFAEVLGALKDENTPLTRTIVRRLSNLGEEERQALYTAWGEIPQERRRDTMRILAEMIEDDFEVDFSHVTRLALTDMHAPVREAAIESSWADESPAMFNLLLPLASIDSSLAVRASALSALGRFILLGELGQFSQALTRQAENVAIRLYQDTSQDVEVRRRALEAVSNSSRAEVPAMIKEAYHNSDEPMMRVSAVYAMGRSCDEQWAPAVLRELDSHDPAMRFEAIRAAGELELGQAVPKLAPVLVDDDRPFIKMAIWALGEIGGNEASRLLENMIEYAQTQNDMELLELIDDAMASASLIGEGFIFDD